MNELKKQWILLLLMILILGMMLCLSSCETVSDISQEVPEPIKPEIECPVFPSYPDLDWRIIDGYYALPREDAEVLARWVAEVEAYPEKLHLYLIYKEVE